MAAGGRVGAPVLSSTVGDVPRRYVDAQQSPLLVAVAETLRDAQQLVGELVQAHPRFAERLEVAEDPLLGLSSGLVQQPDNLDSGGGLPVLYLGGAIWQHNWQARVVTVLRPEQVVIIYPRHERAVRTADWEQRLLHLAWRHLQVLQHLHRDPAPQRILLCYVGLEPEPCRSTG